MAALTLAQLGDHLGKELGVSEWTLIDQTRINQFADCTGDHQWIHVDVERARRESPFRSTIAHGYLTLSLIAHLSMQLGAIPVDVAAGLNYGLDKIRFLAPVPVGSRVRLRTVLISAEPKEGGQILMRTGNTIEIEGSDKPALVAEALALLVPARSK